MGRVCSIATLKQKANQWKNIHLQGGIENGAQAKEKGHAKALTERGRSRHISGMMPTARTFLTLDPFFEGGGVMGRIAANTGFLRALLTADPFDAYHFFLPDDAQIRIFKSFLQKETVPQEKVQCFTRQHLPAALASTSYYCAHLSDCMTSLPALSRVRSSYSKEAFPITGVTHSLSYSRFAPLFLSHLWPGASQRDCIVVTSDSAKAMIEKTFTWLRDGYGVDAYSHPGPSLAQVPLGIDAENMPAPGPKARRDARDLLGLPQERWTLLCFGRLSPAHKYDVVPLLRALQRAIAQGMDSALVTLVLAGWTDSGSGGSSGGAVDTWKALAANLGIHVHVLRRPTEEQKRHCYLAADCFVSPSDNIQETFGLTLLEANLAGLPVVASDFNGYRNLITHEVNGLLVPSYAFPADPDLDALGQLLRDDTQHFFLAQQTALDVPKLADALLRLYSDPAMSARLGMTGRALVHGRYAWPRIIDAYCRLWEQLWRMPWPEPESPHAVSVLEGGPPPSHPLHFPYAKLFADHPSDRLRGENLVRRSRFGEAIYRGQDHPQHYVEISSLLQEDVLRRLIILTRKPITVQDLVQRIKTEGGHPEAATRFCLHWALKQDIVEIVLEEEGGS